MFSFKKFLQDIQELSILFKICLAILFILSILSLFQGINSAIHWSGDFQWQPSALLSKGINPYLYYLDAVGKEATLNLSSSTIYCLSCKEEADVISSQFPNYAHALYVILIPLAKLDLSDAQKIWALLNIALTVLTFLMLSKKTQLGSISLFFILLIYLSSTSFRNTLGAGQQSILVLFAFTYLITGNRFSNLLSGLAYLKYSFAPPLALYIFIKKGGKGILISIIIPLLGFIIFYLIQSEKNLFLLLMQPLAVNGLSVGNGLSDLMTIATIIFNSDSQFLQAFYVYIFPILASLILLFILVRKSSDALYELTIVSLISLLFYKHLIYDYIFLLPALFYSLNNLKYVYSKLSIICIMYFWFGIRILYSFDFYFTYSNMLVSKALNFIILGALLLIVFLIKNKNKLI